MSRGGAKPKPKPNLYTRFVGSIDRVSLIDGSELRQGEDLALLYDGHIQMLICRPADEAVGTRYIPLHRIESMYAVVRHPKIEIGEEKA